MIKLLLKRIRMIYCIMCATFIMILLNMIMKNQHSMFSISSIYTSGTKPFEDYHK